MPGRLKVKVVSGRHLPVMDRSSELTDAFVEVKFGSMTHKTDVCLKSLNPSWNSEWFTFEVDDEHLQDEPLQIRVLDHDTYSSHDAIGKVYIDIDPLLAPDSANALHGWFPIYDTMHGIRGEILLLVKIELFADFNRFKKSSCGIKFICGTVVPECYKISAVHGFVEELVVSEDPEYQWIDKLRTPRATNEARQRLFSQVSGELQRRIGMKVFEMGGNAVVGYHQHFDIEGEFGVVVRGIGTAVSLELRILRIPCSPQPATPTSQLSFSPTATTPISESPIKFMYPPRSSSLDSDPGPAPTAGGLYPGQSWNASSSVNEVLESVETPFFTLTEFPPNFLVHLGGVVSAHSVKLLDKIHNPDDPETRDAWWRELRQEIKSHSSALSCNAVVGYKEFSSISDELILLSAQGTAAVVNQSFLSSNQSCEPVMPKGPQSAAIVLDTSHPFEKIDVRRRHNSGSGITSTPPQLNFSFPVEPAHSNIELFRVPYHAEAPFPIKISYSPLDETVPVPEVIFTTIDIPSDVHVTGKGTMIQARFCRSKKKCQGEAHAAAVGDILPFIEYELQKQLYNKLKLRGMNSLFGLQVRIRVGENIVIGLATATAAYVTALPPPERPDLSCQNVKKGSSAWDNVLRMYNSEVEKSRDFFNLHPIVTVEQNLLERTTNSDASILNSSTESKQSLPVSIEDPDDAEQLRAMIDPLPPDKCYMSNCQHVPGLRTVLGNLQTFSMFWRVKYREGAGDRSLNRGLNATCEKTFASMWHRLSRLSPAFCLCGVRFNLLVPEDDEINIWISASAVGYKEFENIGNKKNAAIDSANPLQFRLDMESKDEKQDNEKSPEAETRSGNSSAKSQSPLRLQIPKPVTVSHPSGPDANPSSRHSSGGSATGSASKHIEILPMSYIPGRRVQRHIGFVNMFLIRETSTVRGGEVGIPGAEPQRGTGSNWFAHSVFVETQAMLRAHVAALGGNALTSYRIEQCTLSESVAKNQAQCLIHVCGDAVICTRPR